MPALSKSQQRLMGMVTAYKAGKLDKKYVTDEIKNIARSMEDDDLEDFATTKHKGLPNIIKKDKKEKIKMTKEELKVVIKECLNEQLNENYKDDIEDLYNQFSLVKKSIKPTSLSLLDIWINMGLKFKLIDNDDVKRLLNTEDN